MAETTVPVDLRNPGQVFACLGLVEAAIVLCGDAEGAFDWSQPADCCFCIRTPGDGDPVGRVLAFLAQAKVDSLAPAGSGNSTAKWKVPTTALVPGAPVPYPDPSSPATLPVRLRTDEAQLVIDHFGDFTRRDNVKFWAGSGGYPAAALTVDALELVRERMHEAAADPFAVAAPQSSSFRLDWRRDYVPLDAGFSPNVHTRIEMVGYPLVELLGAIGLTHARPQRLHKLAYRYAVAAGDGDGLLPAALLRAALGGARLPFPMRRFRMNLGWPGQENQARCIVDVTEEASP